jgi:tetratricopeptide (TPR) repeat protein
MSFNKAKALKTASKYVQQGKFQAAIEEYRKIVQAEPNDITTLNTLGDLYVKAGYTDEAIQTFLRIAEHYRTAGFNLKAIAMFKKINKLDPANVEIGLKLASLYAQQKLMADARHQYLMVAEHYLRTGQNKQALEVYQKIADLDPENTTIQLKLAEAYLREQQLDKAYEAFVNAATELQRQGRLEEALQTYLKAIKTNPEDRSALSQAVNLYIQRGEAQRAVPLIEHLLELRHNDPELLVLLGRVHQAANELDEAEAAIARAVEIDPARFQYALDLASFFTRNGYLDRALHQLDRVIEVMHERREEEKAIALLHEVIARDANHFGALERLAAIYSRLREDHNLSETLNTLADAAIRKGADEVAIKALRQLVQLEPDEIAHRRRLRSLGLSDEQIQRINAPSFAPPEPAWSAPQTSSQPIYEFEFSQAQSAVAGAHSTTQLVELHPETTEQVALSTPEPEQGAEFEVSIACPDSGHSFSFSEGEMVDDVEGEAPSWGPVVESAGLGFEAFSPEIDLSDELIASSSQSFLESYLEGAEEQTAGQPPSDEARLEEELSSFDFYLSQGILDLARYSLETLTAQFPNHPRVKAASERFKAASTAAPSQRAEGSSPTNELDFSAGEQEQEAIFVIPETASALIEDRPQSAVQTTFSTTASSTTTASPLDDLLEEFKGALSGIEDKTPAATLSPEVNPSSPQQGPSELLEIFDEFKFGTEQLTSSGDFETHYNLGLAYKEMEMFDEAIEQFQQAFKIASWQPPGQDYLLCCSMLGFCFMQKDLPRLAVMWFKKGLDVPARTEDEYQALRYDLGLAYERLGDLERAYDTFSEVYAIDVNYRGVTAKLRELEAQLNQAQ